jgi:hypothetical protein
MVVVAKKTRFGFINLMPFFFQFHILDSTYSNFVSEDAKFFVLSIVINSSKN